MQLVSVCVRAGAGIERDAQVLKRLFRICDVFVFCPWLGQRLVHQGSALAFLRQDIVEIGVDLIVRVGHRGFPILLWLGWELAGDAARFVDHTEHIEEIRKGVENTTGIEIAETEGPAVGAAGVIRKDRLQSWVMLQGCAPLFTGESRNSHHSYFAVRPRLSRYPFDRVVVIPRLVAIFSF